MSGIQKLVSSAIENAEAGLPVIPPPPPKHASSNPYSNTYPPNFGGAGPVGPTATPVQNAAGAPGEFLSK